MTMIPSTYLVDGCLQTDRGLVELDPPLMELILLMANTTQSEEPLIRSARGLVYHAGQVLKTAIPHSATEEYITRNDPPPSPPVPAKPTQARKIREWAKENGFQVTGMGRLPREVHDAYKEAHA